MEPFKAMDLAAYEVRIVGPAKDQKSLEHILSYFSQATGAVFRYIPSETIERDLRLTGKSAALAHVAILPDISFAKELARQGGILPLPEELKKSVLQNYVAGQSWLDLARFKDREEQEQFFGLFYRVDIHSLLWYSRSAFAEADYQLPSSIETLFALSEQMLAEGYTPWCSGLADGNNSGWPATNWVEDFLLRLAGTELYDAWISNHLPFNDTHVQQAFEYLAKVLGQDGYVKGGLIAQFSLPFAEGFKGLLSYPSECFLYHQTSLVGNALDFVANSKDLDVFYLPTTENAREAKPLIVSAPLWVVMQENEAVWALLSYLQTALAHELWMTRGEFLSPHLFANAELYPSGLLAKQAEILREASSIRLDASEQMPPPVRAAFSGAAMDYLSGADLAEVLTAVQTLWQGLK